MLRPIAAALGVILAISGLFWAGQGAGLIQWPESSFMISNANWITYGLLTAAVGIGLFVWSRRRPA